MAEILMKPDGAETMDYRVSVEKSTSSLVIRSQHTTVPLITYQIEIDDSNVKDNCNGVCDNIEELSAFIQKAQPFSKGQNESGIQYRVISTSKKEQFIEFITPWGKKFKWTLTAFKEFDMKLTMQSMMLCVQQMQPKRVSFNGIANNNQQCTIYDSFGISKVIRESTGIYVIYFDKPLKTNNYTVSLTANMWNTGGVIVGLEGNNRKGDTYYRQTEESFRIGTRCPRQNANRDCDLVNAVIYHKL
eukprot:984863_1